MRIWNDDCQSFWNSFSCMFVHSTRLPHQTSSPPMSPVPWKANSNRNQVVYCPWSNERLDRDLERHTTQCDGSECATTVWMACRYWRRWRRLAKEKYYPNKSPAHCNAVDGQHRGIIGDDGLDKWIERRITGTFHLLLSRMMITSISIQLSSWSSWVAVLIAATFKYRIIFPPGQLRLSGHHDDPSFSAWPTADDDRKELPPSPTAAAREKVHKSWMRENGPITHHLNITIKISF